MIYPGNKIRMIQIMSRSIFFILMILSGLFSSFAQKHPGYRMENITSEYIKVEKGLSQNTVNTIFQDSEGFLWIGTWSGLNRFDGYSFKTFDKNYRNPEEGLTYSEIIDVIEDDSGYIWAASFIGLNRIKKHDFSIKKFTTETHGSMGMVSDTITCLMKDRKGSIWIGTTKGVLILDPETESFSKIQSNPRNFNSLSSNSITALLEDYQGNIWIGTADGLNKYLPETGDIIKYYASPTPGNLSSSNITALENEDETHIWIGTPQGLNRHHTETKWFDCYFILSPGLVTESTNKALITSLLNDSRGELWVGTREFGLYIFDKQTLQFRNAQNFIPDQDIFQLNSVLELSEDNRGLLWIGTSHKGIVKLIPESNVFREYFRGRTIYGIVEPVDSTFWFGTQNGIIVYNRDLNITTNITHEFDDPNTLISDLISDLYLDGDNIWIGTHNGANKYNIPTGKFELYSNTHPVNTLAGQEVWNILRDWRGDLWFCTSYGLTRIKENTGEITTFRHDPEDSNSLSNNACYHILEQSPGIYLISTQSGLNRYNQVEDKWEVFLPVPGDLTSISSDYVFGTFKDSKEVFWVHTNGGGFNRFDPETGTFEPYTTEDGLSNDVVYGIAEDDLGYLWLTTNNGLSQFDPVEERFKRFDVQDGILSNEFNINSVHKTREGELLLGGVNGITSFFPTSGSAASSKPPVFITRFVKFSEGNAIEIPVSDTIHLKHYENSFLVDFAALDFLNPFKNTYEYYLENFDNDWNILEGGLHQVEYRKLSPGSYILHVIGSNNLGVSDETQLTIKIVPAWWQTFLFRIGIVSLSIILIASVLFARSRAVSRKHRMEKQILTVENELIQSQKFALRSQMNPHFIFNALNSIQNFVLKNDVDSANYYLSNFSIMMRKVLEFSQYNFITLNDELELIKLYLKMEKLRFSNKFEVEIKIDPRIDIHLIRIPPMLLQPYLENSILHGLQLIKHKGLLTLSINERGEVMDIIVEDNGIGREKAREIRQKKFHQSKGLLNIEKRIQLYNKLNPKPIRVRIEDLTDDNGKASGTRVILEIPIHYEDPEQ
jgi:ligand-binding sensor domain-containing protein